jgi:hypothetical protein
MRITFDHGPVGKSAGVTFIGIADQIALIGMVAWATFHFFP